MPNPWSLCHNFRVAIWKQCPHGACTDIYLLPCQERMADTERENAELKMREALVLRFSQTGLAGALSP